MVVSEMGEQWSPHTAPAMQAEIEITIKVGLVLANTLTTMGIRMPKVPHDVPVANASPHPTRKMIAGSRFNRPSAQPLIAEATYSAAPRPVSYTHLAIFADVGVMILAILNAVRALRVHNL